MVKTTKTEIIEALKDYGVISRENLAEALKEYGVLTKKTCQPYSKIMA